MTTANSGLAHALLLKDDKTIYYTMLEFGQEPEKRAPFILIIDTRLIRYYENPAEALAMPVISVSETFDGLEEFLRYLNGHRINYGFAGQVTIHEHLIQGAEETWDIFCRRAFQMFTDFHWQ